MFRSIAALTISAILTGFIPLAHAQSTTQSAGTAEDLSGLQPINVQLERSTGTPQGTFDPFSVSPIDESNTITRTQSVLDLDTNSAITLESNQVEPSNLRGDSAAGQEDRIQIQVQTNQ